MRMSILHGEYRDAFLETHSHVIDEDLAVLINLQKLYLALYPDFLVLPLKGI